MSKNVKIGVFIPNEAQLLDTACVDVLGSMSKKYLSMLPVLPPHVASLAPDVTVIYITSKFMGGEVPQTSDMTIKATCDYTDAAAAPGALNIVVVPGPDPSSDFEEGALEWLRQQCYTDGVDILCICTGIFLCGAAGILNGKQASGPRGLQDLIKKKWPEITLVGSDQRWVQDGNIWSSGKSRDGLSSSLVGRILRNLVMNEAQRLFVMAYSDNHVTGGITNGNELMAAYARSNSKHFPQPVVEIGLAIVEVGDRGQFYEESESMAMMGIAWQVAKAWFQLRFLS